MKKGILAFVLSICILHVLSAQITVMKSPDENVATSLKISDKIYFSVYYNDKKVVQESEIGLQFNQSPYLGGDMKIVITELREVDELWAPVLGQYEEVLNHANEFTITLKEKSFPARDLQLVFRLYNDGVAFRYVIPESFKNFIPNYEQGGTIALVDEIVDFSFLDNHTICMRLLQKPT
jgi:alpha-glucosidase